MARKYLAWVEGALKAGEDGKAAQDEIVVTMMIWMIDFRAIDAALDLAAHVLKHGLKLPERYNRTAGSLVAEEIATVALAQPDKVTLEQQQPVAPLPQAQAPTTPAHPGTPPSAERGGHNRTNPVAP